MIRAKVVGAGGYGGVGITELLLRHPEAEATALVDVENSGVPISDIYPHLRGFCDMQIVPPDDPAATATADVVFMATPDGVGMQLAPEALALGARVIDYSGDFRFNSVDAYALYADRIGINPKHASPELLPQAVYGLAELHRGEITSGTRVIGNPGCFAVSCILGLAPALQHGVILPKGIVCDCKTGVSGAGRKPKPAFHYPAMQDQMTAYRLTGHQHVCEIERELSLVAGRDIQVTFTAQVVPVCRGIMSTLYGRLVGSVAASDVVAMYRSAYAEDVFVRVFEANAAIGTAQVRGTNYCNLVVTVDERCGMLRVVSYIDNLVKGQAGSALQNMNLIFGLPETAGLDRPGLYP